MKLGNKELKIQPVKQLKQIALPVILTLGCLCGTARAQDPAVRMHVYHIDGPTTPADFPQWIADMKRWRIEYLKRLGYTDAEYQRPELRWAESSFIQPQMMVEDRFFYDPVAGRYTVDRYLDDLEQRYGGIDSVLVWPTYPNIGIDNRNQFDHYRDLPGGMAGLKQMVADFHRRHVRVLFPIMPWDLGTRNEGHEEYEVVAQILSEIGADGVNGDTMNVVPRIFRTASDRTGHPLVFESEGLYVDEGLAYNNMNWGKATNMEVPAVAKFKWLEPRHMIHISNRWQRDKNVDLQYAFFNGTGVQPWENVWGIWNEMTPRDSEICRRIGQIDRKFADLLISADWVPHTPAPLQFGIYASKFPGKNETLWTIVNKNEFDVPGQQMRVPHQEGKKYYDLWHGVELSPVVKAGMATLSFDMEAGGYGALLASAATAPRPGLKEFLAAMEIRARTRLNSFSRERRFLPQQIVEIPPTKPAASAPAGMVAIPAGEFEFRVRGLELEGGNEIGVDVQYPWENSPRRNHFHTLQIKSFFVDRYPVSNADFKKFVEATKYQPKDDHNFLRDWKNGTYPPDWANKPVTWISIEDARAYAAWAGKRLPHEWEWQYAAQGTDGRTYPWGNTWYPEATPLPEQGHDLRGPDAVDAHPKGASPLGVMDLMGNVWQWTDEYRDEHTRAAIVRGGSYYQPQGSRWYFPQTYNLTEQGNLTGGKQGEHGKLTEHGKLLLMAPGKDRAGTVGFRCVVDAP